MLKYIDEILYQFQVCFKRKETFLWFSIMVIGFMLRTDYRGVTSIVGTLYLEPGFYETMIHFFRSKATNLELIKYTWQSIVIKNIVPVKIHNKIVMIGDHIKTGKESRKMPGVKKLYQDSENFGKARFIYGHQHGMTGVLAEGETLQLIPMDIELHDGIEKIEEFRAELEHTTRKTRLISKGKKSNSKSKNGLNSIVRMMEMVKKFTKDQGKSVILLLDAFFSNATAFNCVYKANKEDNENQITLVTRGKSNTVAFKAPETQKPKGRKRKYGEKIKFNEILSGNMEGKSTDRIKLYDKMESIDYICMDLIWKPVKRLCRFVLVKTKEKTMILISSDMSVEPIDMIRAYSYRFKIEVAFKTLKYSFRTFFYHFWTSAMPRLSRYKKEADLSEIEQDEDKKKIVLTLKAIETFTLLSCIAMGMLTIISLKFEGAIWNKFTGWLRTISSKVPSAETTRNVLHDEWLINFNNLEKYTILSQIQKYQKEMRNNMVKSSA